MDAEQSPQQDQPEALKPPCEPYNLGRDQLRLMNTLESRTEAATGQSPWDHRVTELNQLIRPAQAKTILNAFKLVENKLAQLGDIESRLTSKELTTLEANGKRFCEDLKTIASGRELSYFAADVFELSDWVSQLSSALQITAKVVNLRADNLAGKIRTHSLIGQVLEWPLLGFYYFLTALTVQKILALQTGIRAPMIKLSEARADADWRQL